MAWAIVLLGAADIGLTAFGLSLGAIEEANPLLAWGLGVAGGWTWLVAFAVPALAVWAVWRVRDRSRWALPTLRLLVVVRAAVIGLHAVWVAVWVVGLA